MTFQVFIYFLDVHKSHHLQKHLRIHVRIHLYIRQLRSDWRILQYALMQTSCICLRLLLHHCNVTYLSLSHQSEYTLCMGLSSLNNERRYIIWWCMLPFPFFIPFSDYDAQRKLDTPLSKSYTLFVIVAYVVRKISYRPWCNYSLNIHMCVFACFI